MWICSHCGRRTPIDSSWRCSSCGRTTDMIDGFPAFELPLARKGRGFPPESFALLAGVEAKNFWFRYRNRLIVWALRHEKIRPARLLEIGCGTGFVLRRLSAEWPEAEVFGSDVFTSSLSFASARVPHASLLQMDATKPVFEDAFDVVAACDVIEHIDRDDLVLSSMRQALRSGGTLLVTVPQHRHLWSSIDEASRHERRYDRDELVRRVEAAGFRVTLVRSFMSLLYPVMRLSRKMSPPVAEMDPLREFRIGRVGNTLLGGIMHIEQMLIRAGADFPVGGSLLLVARRG